MPRVAACTRTRILQRLELESPCCDANASTIGEESHSVRGDEMGHWPTLPDVTVQPEATIHRVNHPLPAALELAIGGRLRRVYYWHPGTPSCCAGEGMGVKVPKKITHWSGYDSGCVAVAAHPPVAPTTMVTMTPGDGRNFSAAVSLEYFVES